MSKSRLYDSYQGSKQSKGKHADKNKHNVIRSKLASHLYDAKSSSYAFGKLLDKLEHVQKAP